MINFKSTSPKYNPKIPVKGLRPRCTCDNCNEPQIITKVKIDGSPSYSLFCRKHHNEKYYNGTTPLTLTANKQGLTPCEYKERAAIIRGFNSANEYRTHCKHNPTPSTTFIEPTQLLQQIRSRIKL